MISAGTRSRWAPVVLSVTVLLMAPTAARCDPPTFPTTLSQGTGCQVWDIAGTIRYVENVPGVGTANLTFVLATDDKGKVTGTGALDVTITLPGIGTTVVHMDDPSAKAKVKSSGGGPARFQLASKLKGTFSIAGRSFRATSNFNTKGEIDAVGGFQGTGNFKIGVLVRGQRVKAGGRFPIAFDVTPDPANDGTWDLDVDVASVNGVKLTGSGDAVLATGRVIDTLEVKGKYSTKKDLSEMKLKNGAGAKIQFKNLEADGASNTYTGGSMKYSILGQKSAVSVRGCA